MIRSPAGFDGGDRIKRYLDYYQPSYGVMMLSPGQFSPASLFAAGEQGVWYDPSDFSTMFQDSAGTTPVTAVEQPVGLIRDKSGRGNNASQTVAGSRPVLSARVNQLTYSEQFDNAAWTKNTATITTNTTVAPDGTVTADTLTENSAGAYILASCTGQFGSSHKFRICVKRGNYAWLRISIGGDASIFNGFSIWVNVNTGGAGSSSILGTGWSLSGYTITPTANGFYIVEATFSGAGTSFFAYIISASADSSLTRANVGSGAGVNTAIALWGADLRSTNTGVGIPTYQRIAAATDYDTSGFPLYLAFDGSNDSLFTGTINPGAVDKTQVFAGVRKLSNAVSGVLAETSISGSVNAGSFTLLAPNVSADYLFRSRGSLTSTGVTSPSSYATPITNVLCGLGDISGDSIILRINGAQVGSNTADQGTGNVGSYPLYIGRRADSILPFTGNLYSLIARFSAANLSTAQISSTETWVNGKTGAY